MSNFESIIAPLTPKAVSYARKCADAQPLKLRERTFRKALAVYGVHYYLLYEYEIESDPEKHYLDLPNIGEVATLLLPDIDREIECCLAEQGDEGEIFSISAIGIQSRIAHVAVRVTDDYTQVEILGFVPAFDLSDLPDQVNTSELQEITKLPDQIEAVQKLWDWYYSDDSLATQLRQIAAIEYEDSPADEIPAQLLRIEQQKRPAQKGFAVKSLLAHVTSASTKEISLRVRSVLSPDAEAISESELDLGRFADDLVNKIQQVLCN
jgi:hypothetical protein